MPATKNIVWIRKIKTKKGWSREEIDHKGDKRRAKGNIEVEDWGEKR